MVHGMLWWLIPLVIFLMMRGNHRRWRGGGRRPGGERESVAELRRVVEDQRTYIDELEGRLARVEDGLEFAERLLVERGAGADAG
ncbi:MAG: hypothetical protein ABIY46_04020 [Gemmatimonadales bacterium]